MSLSQFIFSWFTTMMQQRHVIVKKFKTVSFSRPCHIIKHRPDKTYYIVIMLTDGILKAGLRTTRARVSRFNFALALL